MNKNVRIIIGWILVIVGGYFAIASGLTISDGITADQQGLKVALILQGSNLNKFYTTYSIMLIVGIVLTFVGLYLTKKTELEKEEDELKKLQVKQDLEDKRKEIEEKKQELLKKQENQGK